MVDLRYKDNWAKPVLSCFFCEQGLFWENTFWCLLLFLVDTTAFEADYYWKLLEKLCFLWSPGRADRIPLKS